MWGKRSAENVQAFCTRLAQCGYSVASVSYRLTMRGIGFGCDVDAAKKEGAFQSASEDVALAIKYIIENN